MIKNTIVAVVASLFIAPAWAGEVPEFTINIKNHVFSPDVVEIPANQKVKLIIKNNDSTPEEFESSELSREKVIPAGSTATVFINPVKAGEYNFIGEFHPDTAKGKLIAK